MSSVSLLELTVSGFAVAETFGGRGAYRNSPAQRRALVHRMAAFNALTETAGWLNTNFGVGTCELYDAVSIAVAECPIGVEDAIFDLKAFLNHVLLMRPIEGCA
jgi:hypothetical protein